MLQNWSLPDERGRCLVLAMRHLGDTVIASGLVNALHDRYPAMPIDILGRPELRDLAAQFCAYREYLEINLPVFGHHDKTRSEMARAFRTLRLVRRRNYTYCINFTGDVRENVLGWMVGAQYNVAPVWDRDHPYKRKLPARAVMGIPNRGIRIPAERRNYYDALQFFATQIGLGKLAWRRDSRVHHGSEGWLTIAMHPGSSHPSKRWPEEKWKALIRALHSRGYRIMLLGSPEERPELLHNFAQEIADCQAEVITENIDGFLSSLSRTDLLVGMDSFSVHAAYGLGVPVVVLHGSSDLAVINPPDGVELSASHLCDVFPCHYTYPCRDSEGAYRCVRGIEMNSVTTAVQQIIGQMERPCVSADSRIAESQTA